MFKNVHVIAMAAAVGTGLLLASASPSLACYVTATPCSEAPAPVVHQGARLYNFAPGGSTANSLRPSASHRAPQRDPAVSKSE